MTKWSQSSQEGKFATATASAQVTIVFSVVLALWSLSFILSYSRRRAAAVAPAPVVSELRPDSPAIIPAQGRFTAKIQTVTSTRP